MTIKLEPDEILVFKLKTGEEIIARFVRVSKDQIFKEPNGYFITYASVLNNGRFVPWLQMLDGSCYGSDFFLPADLVGLVFGTEDIDPVLVENFERNVLCL